jgi:predicted Zn-dependent peptidase
MEFLFHTLSNGIRIVHKPTKNGQVAHFGLTVNAGSRDEEPQEQGLAHFIEHGLFKGTQKRKPFHILNRMDSVGAELNAYTTKEETVIYASFLKAHFKRAVEVIADIALNSTFPEKEIAKERDVILDEILSYQDNPSELIFDDFEEIIYGDHPIGRNILGTEESIRRLDAGDIRSFIDRRYRTSEMVISSVGNVDFRMIIRWCEQYFGLLPQSSPPVRRTPVTHVEVVHKEEEMDTYQAHLVMGGEAYPTDHPLKPAAVLLNNYLGGPAMNSRLNMSIREKHGIAYNIESAYHPYTDTGVFTIYLGTDKRTLGKSEKLIYSELKRLRDKRMTETTLHRAKQQLKGQFALAQEGGANLMQAIGKSLLVQDSVDTTEEIFEKIDAISTSYILEVANTLLDKDRLSTLIYR